MIVYVDLLICCNLLIHFALFLSTAALCAQKPRFLRLMLGSLLGSGYSFLIFLTLDDLTFLLIKAGMAVSLVLIVFGFGSIRRFVRSLICFLAINLLYGGGMYAVCQMFAPRGVYYQNGVTYLACDLWGFAVGMLISYLLLRLFCARLNSHRTARAVYPICLRVGENTVHCKALYDSGNRLTDPYSGKPVVILSQELTRQLLPKEVADALLTAEPDAKTVAFGHKCRLIPLHTVHGCAMLGAFEPDEAVLCGVRVDFMAAVSKGMLAEDTDALLPAAAAGILGGENDGEMGKSFDRKAQRIIRRARRRILRGESADPAAAADQRQRKSALRTDPMRR